MAGAVPHPHGRTERGGTRDQNPRLDREAHLTRPHRRHTPVDRCLSRPIEQVTALDAVDPLGLSGAGEPS